MKRKPAKHGNLLRNINALLKSWRWTRRTTRKQHKSVEKLGAKVADLRRRIRKLK